MQFFLVIFIVFYPSFPSHIASFTSTKIKTEMMPNGLNVENYDIGITQTPCFIFFLTNDRDGADLSNTLTINI